MSRERKIYPKMSDEEKANRVKVVAEMYEVLGVRSSELRMRSFLNHTSPIPYKLFHGAIRELSATWVAKDRFGQCPLPGDVREVAVKMTPRRDREDEKGNVGEPEWARRQRRIAHVLSIAETNAQNLASSGLTLLPGSRERPPSPPDEDFGPGASLGDSQGGDDEA